MDRGGARPALDPLRGGRRIAVVLLPGILRDQAGGQGRFEVDTATVGDALRTLPVADLIFDEHGALRPLVNVYLDGVDAREHGGLEAPLPPDATVRIVQAVAGG
jgi:molybdopterin converting factor small subunit